MAHDARLTRSNEYRYTKLAKSTTVTFTRLSDQLVEKLGTSRIHDAVAVIGDTKETKEKIINDYVLGL